MPRGRRSISAKTLEEQLLELDAAIEEYKNKIIAAKEKKKELLGRKEKEDLASLLNVVKASGKTPSELLEMIQSSEEKSA